MDSVGGDLESLESFAIQDISRTALVDQDLGHHEVFNNDGDNYGVVLVGMVGTLDIIRKLSNMMQRMHYKIVLKRLLSKTIV